VTGTTSREETTVRSRRVLVIALAVATLVAACGDDDMVSGDSTTTSTTESPSTSSTPEGLEQPAIWPAVDVVFDTPEAAAEDFVTEVLDVPPVLGEFQQGDARSGEVEVFSPGEGDAGTPVVRGLLLLRQLGPSDGWFVLAAVNDNASITAPASMAEVPAGPLIVEGRARGFEANVVVTAFEAGDRAAELDQVITHGGAFEAPEPFTVTLDLSAAGPRDMIVILVRGGTGLETDPGEFGAIPVEIES
jgi:hypothetical protein